MLRGVRFYEDCTNTDDFAEILGPSLNNVLETYKAAGKPLKDLSQKIHRLEKGTGTMSYVMLRAYAELLQIPEGLLILYSHAVGHVTRNQAEDMSKVLNGTIAVLTALNAIVERSTTDDSELVTPHEEGALRDGRYIVRPDTLASLLEIYRRFVPLKNVAR
jgi:hypothetical protein